MPRTSLTPQEPPGSYPGTIGANEADLSWEAADAINGNDVVLTGREMVLARNDNVGAQPITFTSVADEYGRTGHITDYSIGAGEYAVFGPFKTKGWIQSDGKLYIDAGSADIKLAVIKLPAVV